MSAENLKSTHARLSGTFLLGGVHSIHRLGFGAMRITGPGIWADPQNPDEVQAVLRRAIELGVNFFDTADSYGPEVSENWIAKTLYPYPSDLVIATKGGCLRQGPDQWTALGRPEYLIQCIEMSLRRLRLETIDLYQLHCIDPLVPLEESVEALKKMQQQGKIRHVGLSNVSISDIKRAQKIVKIVSVQNLYNIMNRESENVLRYCETQGLAFIPWFPLASGDLAHVKGTLDKIARLKGATVSQVSLAWLLKRSPVMLPIPGTSSVSHLEENVAAASIALTNEEVAQLDALSAAPNA